MYQKATSSDKRTARDGDGKWQLLVKFTNSKTRLTNCKMVHNAITIDY